MVGAHAAAPHSVGRGDRRFVRRAVLLRPRARVRAHRAQAARRLVQKRAVRALPLRGRRASLAVVPRRPGSPGGRRRLRHGRGLGGGVSAWVPVERARERRTRARETNALAPAPPRGPRACGELPAFPSRLRTRVRRALRSLRAARSRRCALTRGKSDRRLHSCVAPRMPNAIPRPREYHRRSAELFAAAGEIFVRRGADRDFSSRFEETNPRTWLENRGKSESNPAKTRANSLDSTSKRREGAEARKSAGKVSRKYLEVVFFFV